MLTSGRLDTASAFLYTLSILALGYLNKAKQKKKKHKMKLPKLWMALFIYLLHP